jgi:uncharacterized protein (TIGR00251 family)
VGHLLLQVRAVPKAGRDEIGAVRNGRLLVRVCAAPEDGKANAAIIKLLAKHWRIPAGSIEIESGHTTRDKTLRISGLMLEDAFLPRPSQSGS